MPLRLIRELEAENARLARDLAALQMEVLRLRKEGRRCDRCRHDVEGRPSDAEPADGAGGR